MIKIAGLKVKLADQEVLRGVDLEVAGGETVALMGVSGSGKSTLLRAVVGLIPSAEGQVWLLGQAIIGATAAKLRQVRRQVGMLFQGNALFDSMTVAENIGFFLREVQELSETEIQERVEELLVRLHLGPIGRAYPAELSGGMKKRVSIARAVAHDPKIVFYDDPTAGLDPVTAEVIADLLLELRGNGERAGILVSNYLPLVTKVATRGVLLSEGKITELGPTTDMFSRELPQLQDFLLPSVSATSLEP